MNKLLLDINKTYIPVFKAFQICFTFLKYDLLIIFKEFELFEFELSCNPYTFV